VKLKKTLLSFRCQVAVAQFAANALTATEEVEDLTMLQSTLFTLQQQQLLQLQLIQQLQHQLTVSSHDGGVVVNNAAAAGESNSAANNEQQTPVKQKDEEDEDDEDEDDFDDDNKARVTDQQKSRSNNNNNNAHSQQSGETPLNPTFASLLNCPNQDPNRPLSPGLQEDNKHDQHSNTLDILQKRAQEVRKYLFIHLLLHCLSKSTFVLH
jgi:hypothetical protein